MSFLDCNFPSHVPEDQADAAGDEVAVHLAERVSVYLPSGNSHGDLVFGEGAEACTASL